MKKNEIKLSNIIIHLNEFSDRIVGKPEITSDIIDGVYNIKNELEDEFYSISDFINMLLDRYDIISNYLDYKPNEFEIIKQGIESNRFEIFTKLFGVLTQQRVQDFKQNKNFRQIGFSEQKILILSSLEKLIKLNYYKIIDTDTRLAIKNKSKDSYIDIMPAERVLGGKDLQGKLYIQMFDKSEISSESLADPTKAYLTTSARYVKYKTTNKGMEISSLEEFEKIIKKFIDKVKF